MEKLLSKFFISDIFSDEPEQVQPEKPTPPVPTPNVEKPATQQPVNYDVIKEVNYDVIKEANDDETQERAYGAMWMEMLERALEITSATNHVITSITSPDVCKQVVYSCKGQRFINGFYLFFNLIMIVINKLFFIS